MEVFMNYSGAGSLKITGTSPEIHHFKDRFPWTMLCTALAETFRFTESEYAAFTRNTTARFSLLALSNKSAFIKRYEYHNVVLIPDEDTEQPQLGHQGTTILRFTQHSSGEVNTQGT
jgi:hypothetical protein